MGVQPPTGASEPRMGVVQTSRRIALILCSRLMPVALVQSLFAFIAGGAIAVNVLTFRLRK